MRRATVRCARAGPRPSRPAVTVDAPERAAIDVVPRERVRGIQPTRAVDARRHTERATSFERSPKRALTLRRPGGTLLAATRVVLGVRLEDQIPHAFLRG